MNSWHVYEYLKQTYMRTGTVPTDQELKKEFSGQIDHEDLEEGILEFQAATRLTLNKPNSRGDFTCFS